MSEYWEVILYIFTGIIVSIITFVVAIYLWNEDTKSEKTYKECHRIVKQSGTFPNLTVPEPDKVIITSTTSDISRFRAAIKKATKGKSVKDVVIIPLREDDSAARREIAIIRQCVYQIPGFKLLNEDFLVCLRNYLCYKLALMKEPSISEVCEFFRIEYESDANWSAKIAVLDSSDLYYQIVLFSDQSESTHRRSILNEVFLPIVSVVYQYQILSCEMSDVLETITKFRKQIMLMLHEMYIEQMIIGNIDVDDEEKYNRELLRIVRDENKWGFLLLGYTYNDKQFQGVAIKLNTRLDYYWGIENYDILMPTSIDLINMSVFDGFFVCFLKSKEAFQSGQRYNRYKGKQKYRKRDDT